MMNTKIRYSSRFYSNYIWFAFKSFIWNHINRLYMQFTFCNVIPVSISRTLFKLTQFSICFRKYNCCYSTETFCSTKVSKQVIIKAHHHDKTNNNSWYVYGVWQEKATAIHDTVCNSSFSWYTHVISNVQQKINFW